MSNKIQDKSKKNEERVQNVTKCRVRIYKITNNMQRCPYIHEMKERLLGEQVPLEIVPSQKKVLPTTPTLTMDQQQLIHHQQPVATVVKCNPDGYGSHTSPTHRRADRAPLMPKEPEDDFHYVQQKVYPKNAKYVYLIIFFL